MQDQATSLTYEQKLQEIFARADRQLAEDVAANRAKFDQRMEVFSADMNKIAGGLKDLQTNLEASNPAPVAAKPASKAPKAKLGKAEAAALEQMRNFDSALAANSYDLLTTRAYREKAQKDGLFTITVMDVDAPKGAFTLATEKALNCKISVNGTRQYAIGGIEEVRVSLASMMLKLENGASLSAVAEKFEETKKAIGVVNAKMNTVYAVNAPKDPAAGVEEKVEAVIEGIQSGLKAVGRTFAAAFTSARGDFAKAYRAKNPVAPAAAPQPQPVKVLSHAERLNELRRTAGR